MPKIKANKNSKKDSNVNKTIELTAEETARAIMQELKIQNMIKREMSYYKKSRIITLELLKF